MKLISDLFILGFVLFIIGHHLCWFLEEPLEFIKAMVTMWVVLPVVVGLVLFPVLFMLYVITTLKL